MVYKSTLSGKDWTDTYTRQHFLSGMIRTGVKGRDLFMERSGLQVNSCVFL